MDKRVTTQNGTARALDEVAGGRMSPFRTTALWSCVLALAALLLGCAQGDQLDEAAMAAMAEGGTGGAGDPGGLVVETGGASGAGAFGAEMGGAGGAGAIGAEISGVGGSGAPGPETGGASVGGTGSGSPFVGTGGTETWTGEDTGATPVIPEAALDTGGADVSAPSDLAAMVNSFACPGGMIVPGTNTLQVNGRTRTLVADFPADTNRRMGILFSWHGYNQAEGSHREASNLQPDGDPNLPVVVITPDDLDFELPVGLDWQLDAGSVANNVDLQFFEAMVGCLNEQYDIDPARIHSLGYSAGSVMTALLHSVYPKLIRNIICISGMWFNDQAQIDAIIFAGLVLTPSWPALDPADAGTVLLTHGGLTDIAAVIINLETMAQLAFPFLKTAGRTVVDCAHNNGHTGHPEIGPDMISRFISENPSDQPSPYLSGGYSGWPSSCMLRTP